MNGSSLRRGPSARSPRAKHLSLVSPRDHEEHMIAKLGELYPFPEWVTLPQVRSTTGCSGPEILNIADALLVRLEGVEWEIESVEIKRSRSDWVKEQKKRRGPLRLFCQRAWVVVPAPANRIILSLHELEVGHGLIEIGTGRPNVIKTATPRRAESPESHPGFMKSLFRSMAKAREREDLDVGAPLQRLDRVIDRFNVSLVCRHIIPRPLTKVFPMLLPCFKCALGLPTDHEYLEAAFFTLPEEDKARLRELINGRRPGGDIA